MKAFLAADRMGVHVIPAHFYSPVASRRDLRTTEADWRRPLSPIPFAWDLDAQAQWLTEQVGEFPRELPLPNLYRQSERVGGFRYGPIEAQFLYSWLRSNAPRSVLEIGSGTSTLVMSQAIERNVRDGRLATAIHACDPFMASVVAGLPHVTADSLRGQEISQQALGLGSGDLLFIDSTHALRTGSELSHLYLEVIPNLKPGVVIHIHDIYLPYLFSFDIYSSPFDWQETALLAALLAGNPKLRVLACMSALHHDRPETLWAAFPEYVARPMSDGLGAPDDVRHFPSSIWLEVKE